MTEPLFTEAAMRILEENYYRRVLENEPELQYLLDILNEIYPDPQCTPKK